MMKKILELEEQIRSYKFFKDEIKRLRGNLIRIERSMYEPKTVKYGEYYKGRSDKTLNDIILKKDDVKKELEYYENIIADLEYKLNKLPIEQLRLIHEIYIRNKSYHEVAKDKGFESDEVYELKKEVKNILKSMLE